MKKGHLLIVDDETYLLSVLSFMMNPYAEKISTAETAMDALNLIDSEKIDCIICDINLPRMSGMEVLRHLHKYGQSIPFFFFTAESGHERIFEAIKLGATDYFFKPQFTGLEKAVNCALNSLPYNPDPTSEFAKLRGY